MSTNTKMIAGSADAQYKALLSKIESYVKRLRQIAQEEEMLRERIPKVTKTTLAITKAYEKVKTSTTKNVVDSVTLNEVKASTALLKNMKEKMETLQREKTETTCILQEIASKVSDMPSELARELDKMTRGGSAISAPSKPSRPPRPE